MEVSVKLDDWRIVESDGVQKIAGHYKLMVGATELAKQQFNEGYDNVKVTFPAALAIKVEALTNEIAAALTAHFTGQKQEA